MRFSSVLLLTFDKVKENARITDARYYTRFFSRAFLRGFFKNLFTSKNPLFAISDRMPLQRFP